MKSKLILYLILLTAISCSKKFDLADHYDPTQSFEVIDQEKPKDGKVRFELRVNDSRHDALLSWLALNSPNWKSTHNRHAGLVIIYQGNFRLLLYKNNDLAVVTITDDEGISQSYKKVFETGGLKFLDGE